MKMVIVGKMSNGKIIKDENNELIVEFNDGSREYYKDGYLHREDGPAIERSDYGQYWYLNGLLHRVDGPAVECLRHYEWCQYGKLHCEDGPAIIYSDGRKKWYYQGTHIPCSSQEEFERLLKLKVFW
jgi:hypothetical protein